MEEQIYYNAVNLACESDYIRIKNLYQSVENRSWSAVWNKIAAQYSHINPAAEFAKLKRFSIRLIMFDDPEYPPLLKETSFTPFGLYILGNLPKRPTIAIVGTRRATEQGKKIAAQLASELAQQEIIIASGLALGIDESAHGGVVKVKGKTVAVLAQGLDEMYPAQNKNLAEKIIANGGAIISEYPIGSPPLPFRFLERNRIISGLSLATIVIEAPARSGALATANFAIQQNREVFVVPGSISHKNYEGSHRLIKTGASLLTEINDIFNALPDLVKATLPLNGEHATNNKSRVDNLFLDEQQKEIFTAIENFGSPVTVDKISELVKLSPQAVNISLSLLVINNLVKEGGGRYYL